MLQLEVAHGDGLHGLVALEYQFPQLHQHVPLETQQRGVPFVGLIDALLVPRLRLFRLQEDSSVGRWRGVVC